MYGSLQRVSKGCTGRQVPWKVYTTWKQAKQQGKVRIPGPDSFSATICESQGFLICWDHIGKISLAHHCSLLQIAFANMTEVNKKVLIFPGPDLTILFVIMEPSELTTLFRKIVLLSEKVPVADHSI